MGVSKPKIAFETTRLVSKPIAVIVRKTENKNLKKLLIRTESYGAVVFNVPSKDNAKIASSKVLMTTTFLSLMPMTLSCLENALFKVAKTNGVVQTNADEKIATKTALKSTGRSFFPSQCFLRPCFPQLVP